MRTVVLQRHGYGRGRHRFYPGFLDFARHCGLQPRLCAPYRAQTKGKVERFIRYLRESFWVPLSSRLAQEGLIVDRETANLAVKRWLREVANVRIHGTTGAIPAERLVSERMQLQPVPTPYGGRTVRVLQARPEPVPIMACNTRCRSTTPLPEACGERRGTVRAASGQSSARQRSRLSLSGATPTTPSAE